MELTVTGARPSPTRQSRQPAAASPVSSRSPSQAENARTSRRYLSIVPPLQSSDRKKRENICTSFSVMVIKEIPLLCELPIVSHKRGIFFMAAHFFIAGATEKAHMRFFSCASFPHPMGRTAIRSTGICPNSFSSSPSASRRISSMASREYSESARDHRSIHWACSSAGRSSRDDAGRLT